MARKPKSRRSVGEIEIDQRIGRRIHERRVVLGLNQTKLADGLGISFRQIQKYEKGANRMGAGLLYGCAELLDVPPEYFFEGTTSALACLRRHWANHWGRPGPQHHCLATKFSTSAPGQTADDLDKKAETAISFSRSRVKRPNCAQFASPGPRRGVRGEIYSRVCSRHGD